MAIRNQLVHDQRRYSRWPVLLACQFMYPGGKQPATLVEISLASAKVSARYMPPQGTDVTIRLDSPELDAPLLLDGTVVRGTWGSTEQGEACRFIVKFHRQSPELISLLRTRT